MRKSDFAQAIKGTDFVLLITCILTSIFGFMLVYSATRNEPISESINVSRECLIMIVAAVIGMILCVIISNIDYNLLVNMAIVAGGICLLLIFALFIWGEAPADRPNAKCWLPFSIGTFSINFQPSELAKPGFLITFAWHISKVRSSINELKNIALLCLHAAVPIGLIILTDDLGSAMVFAFMFLGMMMIAGLKFRFFAIGFGAVIAAAPLLWTKFLSSFHRQRILAVYYPDALSEKTLKNVIYQQQRCLNAIGSGGFFGDGYLKGTYTQSSAGVPVNESDMVFSVVGEEFGFVGAVGLIILLAIIVARLCIIGSKSSNMPGSIICYGTAFMIGSQTVLNIGMCLKLLPCVGITLPFVSAGGSANMCVYIAIGLCMSVARMNKDTQQWYSSIYISNNL